MVKKKGKEGKLFNDRAVAASKDTTKSGSVKNADRIDKGLPAQPNQWQATTRQMDWLNYYMNPKEEATYGNPYQAAIKAGYSESYARNIMSSNLALQWVQSAKSIMRSMNVEHIRNVLEDIALNGFEKASDRIAAAKLLGTDQGMFVQKNVTAHVGLEEALAELE